MVEEEKKIEKLLPEIGTKALEILDSIEEDQPSAMVTMYNVVITQLGAISMELTGERSINARLVLNPKTGNYFLDEIKYAEKVIDPKGQIIKEKEEILLE